MALSQYARWYALELLNIGVAELPIGAMHQKAATAGPVLDHAYSGTVCGDKNKTSCTTYFVVAPVSKIQSRKQ